jgi:hypothetical protein
MSGRVIAEPAHRCGNCRNWDDGECMVMANVRLPFWAKRIKDWTLPTDGTDCSAFAVGRYRDDASERKPGRRRRRA